MNSADIFFFENSRPAAVVYANSNKDEDHEDIFYKKNRFNII